jgi:ATP-binding cassette subfamily B (MDR/TAP) protein 1
VVAATALSSIAPQVLALTKASSAAGEMFRIIDRTSDIDSLSEDGLVPEECTGNIEIKDVHFAYPMRADIPVLKGVNISVPEKTTCAIVGPSGSGKSTIVGLLERWYEQSGGVLLLDGIDIRQLNLRWLRTNMRLVQQEPVLFSGTVFDNVVSGLEGTDKANISKEEQRILVERACRDAYADEFIERLPNGYDTQVGERAMMLSGGQKQRIAIARSIVSDPKVLLLDEATSALDPKAEKLVQKALDNVSDKRTVISISHKCSTIRNAHNIVVISNGSVVEQGPHADLMTTNGAYARLVRAQDLGGADGEYHVDSDKEEETKLNRTQTQATSIHDADGKREENEKMPAKGLITCIVIAFWEQRSLWRWFILLLIATVLGGERSCSVQAPWQLTFPRNHVPSAIHFVCQNRRSFPTRTGPRSVAGRLLFSDVLHRSVRQPVRLRCYWLGFECRGTSK